MQIKGMRKVIMTAICGAVIALVPDMSTTQVQLLETLIVAAFAGNGVEHLSEVLKNGRILGRNSGSPVRSVAHISGSASQGQLDRSTH